MIKSNWDEKATFSCPNQLSLSTLSSSSCELLENVSLSATIQPEKNQKHKNKNNIHENERREKAKTVTKI